MWQGGEDHRLCCYHHFIFSPGLVRKFLTNGKRTCTMYKEAKMTKERLEKERQKLNNTLVMYARLEAAGLIPYVDFASDYGIFMEADVDYLDLRRRLRKLFGVNETLVSYYMSMGRLAVKYAYGEWEVIFNFSNPEEMLERLTGGTCHIERVEAPRREQLVVCDV